MIMFLLGVLAFVVAICRKKPTCRFCFNFAEHVTSSGRFSNIQVILQYYCMIRAKWRQNTACYDYDYVCGALFFSCAPALVHWKKDKIKNKMAVDVLLSSSVARLVIGTGNNILLKCSCVNMKPISKLYFCRHCTKLRCPQCVSHEVMAILLPKERVMA